MAKTKHTKILVSLWDTLFDALNRRVDDACLRRDAFLQRVVATELPYLESEIPQANSNEARRAIAKHLALLPRKQLTLNLETQTVRRLDEVCKSKNLVRDSFFNRLVLCLLAPPDLLGIVFDAKEIYDDVKFNWEDPGIAHRWQALRTIPEYVNDPFAYIRTCLSLSSHTNKDESIVFYQMFIPPNLFGEKKKDGSTGPNTLGLNVYLPDFLVPGHPAAKELVHGLLHELEAQTPTKA